MFLIHNEYFIPQTHLNISRFAVSAEEVTAVQHSDSIMEKNWFTWYG
jgi:hypothetical protein